MGLVRLALAINTVFLTLLFDDSGSDSSSGSSGDASGASSESPASGAGSEQLSSGISGAAAGTTKQQNPTDADLADIPLPGGDPKSGDPSAELPSIESVYGQKRTPLK